MQPDPAAAVHEAPAAALDQLGLLAGALAKAQGEFPAIPKEKTAHIKSDKANYTYRYAELGAILSACRPALSKHALAITQIITNGNLITWLLHEAGGRLESVIPIPTFNLPQALGSWLTYMRRYTVSALLGVAAEDDDDGAAAQDHQVPEQRRERPTPTRPTDPTPTEARDALCPCRP